MRGLKELRVKESDRLAATADMLRVNGVDVSRSKATISSSTARARVAGGGMVATHMDHRLAMSALVMGLAQRKAGRASTTRAFIATSFPDFTGLMRRHGRGAFMIIAIDGPAASGKGTLAKRLAAHYGFGISTPGCSIARSPRPCSMPAARRTTRRRRSPRRGPSIPTRYPRRSSSKATKSAKAASYVAAIPEVRAALVAFQRAFAQEKPGAVIDGRDIGTVIVPDAEVKIFVTATAAGAGTRAGSWSFRAGARPSMKRRCLPISSSATSAT